MHLWHVFWRGHVLNIYLLNKHSTPSVESQLQSKKVKVVWSCFQDVQ